MNKSKTLRWSAVTGAAATACYLVIVPVSGPAAATPSSGFTPQPTSKGPFSFAPFNLHASNGDDWTAKLQTHGVTDAYFTDNAIAAGGTSGWHSHPGPSLIYVISGTVTDYTVNDDGTCSVEEYTKGQGFVDDGTSPHMIRNDTTTAAETYAVQLLPKGAKRRMDQPAPGCALEQPDD